MMFGHIELIDDSLQMRSCSLDGQNTCLLELPVRHTSVLDIPGCVFEHAIGLPHIDQLLTNCPRGAVISKAVPNGLHQIAGTWSDMLRESIGAVVRATFVVSGEVLLQIAEQSTFMLSEQCFGVF